MSKMPYRFERRSHRRFKVEGATVDFAPADLKAGSPKGVQGSEVVNISVGGLSFLFAEELALGMRLSLVIRIPDREPMRLIGRVKWRGQGPRIAGHIYGVEFSRYGTGPGQNDPRVEAELTALEILRLGPESA